MVMGCYLTTAFAVAGMSAWMLLRVRTSRRGEARRRAPLAVHGAVVRGDLRAGADRHRRPARPRRAEVPADEARGDRGQLGARRGNMPLRLFALPDEEAETNRYEIAIPKIGSLILTHAFDGVVPGLKDVPPDQRPPVWPVFFSFRIMVGDRLRDAGPRACGACTCAGRARCSPTAVPHAAMIMTPSGFGAVLFGWFTAEIGRQPYVVYGHLRTADAVSPVSRGRGDGIAHHLRRRLCLRVRLRLLLPRQAPAATGPTRSRRCAATTWRQEAEASALGAGRGPRRRTGHGAQQPAR